MCISFLNDITEHSVLEVERSFFADHPTEGCFLHYPLYGAILNPCDLPEVIRIALLKHHDFDGIEALVKEVNKALHQEYSKPTVLYWHCRAGKDRTGEASCCYWMRYKKYSYDQALRLSEKIAGRDLKDLSVNAVKWYAFYLRDVLHLNYIGKIDGE